jgi:hypothetical protein
VSGSFKQSVGLGGTNEGQCQVNPQQYVSDAKQNNAQAIAQLRRRQRSSRLNVLALEAYSVTGVIHLQQQLVRGSQ